MNNLEPAEPFKSLFDTLMNVPQEDLDGYAQILAEAHKECEHDGVNQFSEDGMFCADCGGYITDDGQYIPNHYNLDAIDRPEEYDLWREERDMRNEA